MLFFSPGKGAFLGYWDDACITVEAGANTPHFYFCVGPMWFMAALAIRILFANSCTQCRWIFKGPLAGWARADFS